VISTQTNLRDWSYTFDYEDDPFLTMEKAGLGVRLQGLISMRYGLRDGMPKSIQEIQKVHGISAERTKKMLKLGIEMLRYYEETGQVKPPEIEIRRERPKRKDPKWQNCVYLKVRLEDEASVTAIKQKIESLLDFPEIMELSWKDRGDGTKWERSLTYKGDRNG